MQHHVYWEPSLAGDGSETCSAFGSGQRAAALEGGVPAGMSGLRRGVVRQILHLPGARHCIPPAKPYAVNRHADSASSQQQTPSSGHCMYC